MGRSQQTGFFRQPGTSVLALFALGLSGLRPPLSAAAPPAPPAPAALARPRPALPATTPPAVRGSERALGCTPARSITAIDPQGRWVNGSDARLCAVLAEQARQGNSQGRTRLLFESNAGERRTHDVAGRFRVFGYSQAARAFLVGGFFQTGSTVLLEGLWLVDARDGSLRRSRYDQGLRAGAAVMSPDGQYLALIAGPRGARDPMGLWLYSVFHDLLYRLGAPPAPPPVQFDCERRRPSRWRNLEHEGYAELEPEVLGFPNATRLRASYGPDNCRERAKQRRTRDWNLAQLRKPWIGGAVGRR